MTYVLVKVEGNNYTIGRVEHPSESIAKDRQAELSKLGIQLEVMTFNEAYGI